MRVTGIILLVLGGLWLLSALAGLDEAGVFRNGGVGAVVALQAIAAGPGLVLLIGSIFLAAGNITAELRRQRPPREG